MECAFRLHYTILLRGLLAAPSCVFNSLERHVGHDVQGHQVPRVHVIEIYDKNTDTDFKVLSHWGRSPLPPWPYLTTAS